MDRPHEEDWNPKFHRSSCERHLHPEQGEQRLQLHRDESGARYRVRLLFDAHGHAHGRHYGGQECARSVSLDIQYHSEADRSQYSMEILRSHSSSQIFLRFNRVIDLMECLRLCSDDCGSGKFSGAADDR